MVGLEDLQACQGCGARVPNSSGASHRYIGASPGCWAVYAELLLRSQGDPTWPAEHRLIVDTYAGQHPGTESLQSIRSVAGHLIALHFVLERHLPPDRITEIVRRCSKHPEFRWLTPPQDLGPITVLDLHRERERDPYAALCIRWASSVWQSWCCHHETIRSWAALTGL